MTTSFDFTLRVVAIVAVCFAGFNFGKAIRHLSKSNSSSDRKELISLLDQAAEKADFLGDLDELEITFLSDLSHKLKQVETLEEMFSVEG